MGITLTIFVGARDPLLMAKLNLCETACCLVDPDDISKYKGYLPAFLTEEKNRILQFSKNIFTQSSDPTYDFVIDDSAMDISKYETFKSEISDALSAQIEDIKCKRLYQEIELQNALINFPSMLLGRKVCELEGQSKGQSALILCGTELMPKFLENIKNKREQFVLIAPLKFWGELASIEVMADFWVCTSLDKESFEVDEGTIASPVVADVTSLPGVVKNFDNVFWSSSPNFLSLDEEHVELVDFKSQWSRGRDVRLLALSVGQHLGCDELIIHCSADTGFEAEAESFLASSDDRVRFSFVHGTDEIETEGKINFTLTLNDLDPEVTKALEFVGTIEDDLDQEKEGEVLHSVLRACDYDALVKMRNGFINYGLINYQEVDLNKKKTYFLSQASHKF